MVVRDAPVASQDGADQGFAVDRELQGEAHVIVVEGRERRVHRHRDMLGSRHLLDYDSFPLQQVHGAQIHLIDDIDLARDKGGLPRSDVADGDQLRLSKWALFAFQ